MHHQDTVSEWPRRWARNPFGFARMGSNPIGVACIRIMGDARHPFKMNVYAIQQKTLNSWPNGHGAFKTDHIYPCGFKSNFQRPANRKK